jgi:hypothetical protein
MSSSLNFEEDGGLYCRQPLAHMVLQITVFWCSGAVLGHVCLGLGVLAWGPCCSMRCVALLHLYVC